MRETLELAGPIAWILLPLGLLLAVASVAGIVLAARRSPRAPRAGVVLLLAGTLAASLGVAGLVQGRRHADRWISAATDLMPVEREHRLRRAYADARVLATLGLSGAALPWLCGLVMLVGRKPRFDEGDDMPPPPPRWSRRVEVSAVLSAVLVLSASAAAREAPLPGRELGDDHPRWRMVEAMDEVVRAEDETELDPACRRFASALGRLPPEPASRRSPAFRAAIKACVERRIQEIAVLSSVPIIRASMYALSSSRLVEGDLEAGALVDAALEEVRKIPDPDDEGSSRQGSWR